MPIVIVMIKIRGPTIAKILFTTTAFLMSFVKSMIIAADNSMSEDKTRKPAIVKTVELIEPNKIFIAIPNFKHFVTLYALADGSSLTIFI